MADYKNTINLPSTGFPMKADLANREPGRKVEVEVRNFDELQLALDGGAEAILLDNMTPAEIKKAVGIVRDRGLSIPIEASGGIVLENIRKYALAGVDSISVGALTHSAEEAARARQLAPGAVVTAARMTPHLPAADPALPLDDHAAVDDGRLVTRLPAPGSCHLLFFGIVSAPTSGFTRRFQALRCRSLATLRPTRKIQARKFCTSEMLSRVRQQRRKASWAASRASS